MSVSSEKFIKWIAKHTFIGRAANRAAKNLNASRKEESTASQRQREIDERWASSGLDDSYKEAFYNNPYIDPYYDAVEAADGVHPGNEVSEFLTGSSAASRNVTQMRQARDEYWANLISESRQNKYNSPDNQASLMRSAGLNPALQGIGDVAEDVGMPDPMFDQTLESGDSDISSLGSIADGVGFLTNLASTILALKQGFAKLKGQNIENEGSEILNNNSMVSGYRDLTSYAEWAADNFITSDFFDNFRDKGDKYISSGLAYDKRALIRDYLPNSKPFQQTVFTRAFDQRLRSNALQFKSMEEFSKGLEARRRAVIADSDLENGFTISVMQCQKAQADCDAAVFRWKSELMDDKVFEELWKSNEFASLRESISESNANAAAAEISYAGSSAVLDDAAAMKDVTNSAKQAFRTALEQMIEEEASAILGATNAAIIQEFYDSYAKTFGANWKYRPLSPDREKLDIALGIGVSGFSQSVSVLDLLLKRKNKSRK